MGFPLILGAEDGRVSQARMEARGGSCCVDVILWKDERLLFRVKANFDQGENDLVITKYLQIIF